MVFGLTLIFHLPCRSADLDYSSYQSIEAIIEFETSQIQNTDQNNYECLADLYLSRAESYLMLRKNEQALIDFKKSYELNEDCSHQSKFLLSFRALFGQAIIYGCVEMMDEFNLTLEALQTILDTNRCPACQENIYSDGAVIQFPSNTPFELKPIIGPDQVSVDDCIRFAKGTAKNCRDFFIFVPKVEVQFVLQRLINELEAQAIYCCRAGGIWKACLQPIVNKWSLWCYKWNVLAIPPDPAWI